MSVSRQKTRDLTLTFVPCSLPMSTTEEPKVEGKKAGKDAPPVSIGWDSHKPVVREFATIFFVKGRSAVSSSLSFRPVQHPLNLFFHDFSI